MRRAQQLQPAREHGALGVGLGLGLELELGLPSSCSRPASTVRWRASASRMPSPDGAASPIYAMYRLAWIQDTVGPYTNWWGGERKDGRRREGKPSLCTDVARCGLGEPVFGGGLTEAVEYGGE